MPTKTKKTAPKKSGKVSKTIKAIKGSTVKKTAAKVKKGKPAAARSAKPAKKPVKASTKKTSVKTPAKASAKSKAVKSKAASSKSVSSKKNAPVKAKAVKAKASVKKPSSVASKQRTVKKVVPPKLTTIKNDVAPAKAPVKKSAKPAGNEIIDILDEIRPYQEEFGEEYMNKKQQEHFRSILIQRKKEFMDEMERTVHHLQDEAANFPDPNDRATQEEEFGLVLRTRDRELKYIKNIEDALQRIDEGEYGYCEACGVEIGVRRLEARPTATLCIDCKTLDEIREKQMGG